MKSKLQLKIEARNLVNAEVNRVAPIVLANFAPLIGQKIIKSSGGLMEKYKALIPAPSKDIQIYFKDGGYFQSLLVKGSVTNDQGHATYIEEGVYISKTKDGNILAELFPFKPLRTDFTESEILEARKEVEETENAFEASKKKLCGFERWDR